MSGGPYPWYMYRSQWSSLPPAPKGNYLDGQTLIITGANSGIGVEATKQLAALSPARLILAVRSVESGEKLAASLKSKYPRTAFEVWSLDLLSFDSIKAFVRRAEGLDRLDVLINNAGMNPTFSDKIPRKASKDGYERTLQTNVLAPVLMTFLLVPLLRKSSSKGHEPKVIFTGSEVHTFAKTEPVTESFVSGRSILGDFNDEAKYVNSTRYMQSKLLLQMITRTLVPILDGITLVNVNPGMCLTSLGREMEFPFSLRTIYEVSWYLFNVRSASKGARNLSTAVAFTKESCDYWSNCKIHPSECTYLTTATGIKAQAVFYAEVLEELEKIAPGCTKVISQ
ncbi:hypothetical protein BCR39DRAFT_580890 [Naematelia encephala]|uniref:Uncharacterized protein n=1 Tax=Naematelia encephala TaxID=71784 RepID=A0A1Y2BFD6_9TREE|nr:hypothetical protein BCR39DRAFT_580890 [Naematelia encephala]